MSKIIEKMIAVFEIVGGKYYYYDGNKKEQVNTQQLKEYKQKYRCICLTRKRGEIKTLEDFFTYIVKCANNLKSASKGKINMFKTGSFSNTALALWKLLKFGKGERRKEFKTEPLTDLEMNIVKNSKGATIFSTKGYEGEGHIYDFISFYPFILQSLNFGIPVRRGKEKKIKTMNEAQRVYNDTKVLIKGFYRCKIYKTEDELTDRMFRFSPDNWYTSIDIMLATILKMKIVLIVDDDVNCIQYTGYECEAGSVVFGNFVHTMFELKEKKIDGAKEILNSLWGLICQKQTTTTTEINDKLNMTRRYINDDGTISYTFEKDKIYNSDFARLKSFLLAEGRLRIAKTMLKHKDNIVRCNTDGFISKCKLDIVTGTMLGDLKYEGMRDHIIVHNANSIQGLKD